MIGGNAQDGIVCNVDELHDVLEFVLMFKYEDSDVNNIKNICRQKIE